METKPVDLELLTILKDVVSDLADPNNQFMISANYYDHQTAERFGERWYIAQIWLQAEASENVTLTDEGLLCDVKLNRHDLSQVSRILLKFDQIWSIQRLASKPQALAVIYHRSDKLNLRRPGDID